MNKEERRIYLNKRRRQRQLRRHIVILLTLCCVCLAGCFGFLSQAKSKDEAVSYKYFTSIMVQPGDTLSSIAADYADGHYETLEAYMEEVRRTNHLYDDDISAGDYLIVPYYSTEFR